jgi:hypothetical protein
VTRIVLPLLAAAILFTLHHVTPALGQAKADTQPKDLSGSWRLVTRMLGAEERKAAPGEERLLHITPTHMTRIVYYPKSRKLAGVVGGRVSVDGTHYVETIEWADEGSRMGKENPESMKFSYKLQGDRLTLEASIAGQKYAEVWERVRP